MSTANQRQQPTVDDVKNFLRQFSRFLRRDFLAILVKMTARELSIKTVRCDWRTRKGMLAFLQTHWARFTELVKGDTIFHWYTQNFEASEKILENRKLMMFIYANWTQYAQLLSSQGCLQVLKAHQTELQEFATSGSEPSNEFSLTEAGKGMIDLIKHFKAGPTTPAQIPRIPFTSPIQQPQQRIQIVSPIQQQQIKPKPSLPPLTLPPQDDAIVVPIKQESSDSPKGFSQESSSSEGLSEYDDIIIEDSLDVFPFEMSIYDTREFINMYPIEDPLIIDEFAI